MRYNFHLLNKSATVAATASLCALCGAQESEKLHKGVRHNAKLDVHRCSGCGLVRLHPLPTEEELAKFYAEDYRHEHEPGVEPEEARRTELPEARARVQRLMPLLKSRPKLLEIGSSSGAFLDSARPFAGSVMGVEPGRRHREWAKKELGLTMAPSLDAVTEKFDLIVLFHVLEHVRHPVEFLKGLLSRLNPGGKVVVEVPSDNDALLSVYKTEAYPPFYYQNAHLWYFTAPTLSGIAEKAGATAEVRQLQRYDLSNHMRWLATGKPGGMGYYQDLFPAALDQAYREALERAGVADTLWAVIAPQASPRRR
jgi:SAM-dependent methyltransferase